MKMFTIITVLVFLFNPLFAQVSEKNNMNTSPIISYENMNQVMNLAKIKPTVLFFKANWCPSCTKAAQQFEEDLDKLKNINLVVVNYDNSKDLKVKYGVTYQHTFVQVSSKGESLITWNGGSTETLLQKIVK